MGNSFTTDLEKFLISGFRGSLNTPDSHPEQVQLGEISLNDLIGDPTKSWLRKMDIFFSYFHENSVNSSSIESCEKTLKVIRDYQGMIEDLLGQSTRDCCLFNLNELNVEMSITEVSEFESQYVNLIMFKILGKDFDWEPQIVTYFRSHLGLFKAVESIRQEANLISFNRKQIEEMTSAKFVSKSHSLKLDLDVKMRSALLYRYDSYSILVEVFKQITNYSEKEIRRELSKMLSNNALEIKRAIQIDRFMLRKMLDLLVSNGAPSQEAHAAVYIMVCTFYGWKTYDEYNIALSPAVQDDNYFFKYAYDKLRNYIS